VGPLAALLVGVEEDAVAAEVNSDQFGICWRSDLAAGIFANLDQIEVVEVLADNYFSSPRRILDSLKFLATQVRVTLHGVGMGLSGVTPPPPKIVDGMARLFNTISAESWSEHLAFVRAGDIEIGHLALPPLNDESIENTIRNIDFVRRVVGAPPGVENISSLLKPPCSPLSESEWLAQILEKSSCRMLLDLHNVVVNCFNFGESVTGFLARLPLHSISSIHLGGGKLVKLKSDEGAPRYHILDDHLHETPPEVFSLLEEVSSRVEQPLTVVLERDGDYPHFEELLLELSKAREAVSRGRARKDRGRYEQQAS
jgi:uncharacterized protein